MLPCDWRQSLRTRYNRKELVLPLVILVCYILLVYRTTLTVDHKLTVVQLVEIAPTEYTTCKYPKEEIESYIFNNPKMAMDDTQLVDYLSSCVLSPPDAAPYNLKDPSEDPSAMEGQNQVVQRLLKNKMGGIFVEAGANDGENISNTLTLERNFGWTGLLVEPDPRALELLKSKHRKAWIAGVGLSTSHVPQKLNFLLDNKDTRYSKLSSSAKFELKKREREVTTVHCFPLYSLLLALNMTTIDYVSLDVEGAELDIIKTIPFHKLKIRVLSVEFKHLKRIPGTDSELKELFQSNGYRLAETVIRGTAYDYIFAHKDV